MLLGHGGGGEAKADGVSVAGGVGTGYWYALLLTGSWNTTYLAMAYYVGVLLILLLDLLQAKSEMAWHSHVKR
jgi:hypothetical protein